MQARDTLAGLDVNVLGLDLDGAGWPAVSRGQPPARAGETGGRRQPGHVPGDRITLGDLELDVVGTSSGTTYYFGLPTVFAPLADVQDWFLIGQPLVRWRPWRISGSSASASWWGCSPPSWACAEPSESTRLGVRSLRWRTSPSAISPSTTRPAVTGSVRSTG